MAPKNGVLVQRATLTLWMNIAQAAALRDGLNRVLAEHARRHPPVLRGDVRGYAVGGRGRGR